MFFFKYIHIQNRKTCCALNGGSKWWEMRRIFLFTIRTPVYKLSVTILAPACAIAGTTDTSHPLAILLTPHARCVPEKSKRIFTRRHLGSRGAVVGFACAVRGAVGLVVLVVDSEDGKGLLAEARVVAAFRGLDSFAYFSGWERGGLAGCDGGRRGKVDVRLQAGAAG